MNRSTGLERGGLYLEYWHQFFWVAPLDGGQSRQMTRACQGPLTVAPTSQPVAPARQVSYHEKLPRYLSIDFLQAG